MIRVVLESPFGANPNRFVPYGRACVAHSLSLGEAPMAMHLLYTQPGILDDGDPAQRQQGIEAAFSWYQAAEYCVVYRNYGLSEGMMTGIDLAERLGMAIHYRDLTQDDMMRSLYLHEPFPDYRQRTATQMIEDAGRLR